MDRQNPYHPTGNAKADGVRAKTNELVEYVMRATAASGPKARRAAELAVTHYENASMWAVKALFSEDAIAGDDGGAKGPDRALAKEISDARDEDPPTLEP
jgi:hypothetical protein